MADNEGSEASTITFKVKASGDVNHTMTMPESASVLELKNKLATAEFENIPVERQRLIYSGRVMKNDDTLASYKVKAGNTIHLVKSAASNPNPTPSTSTGPVPQAVPSNMAAGTSASNLLAGLTGARFAGQANLPSADLFGADGGMGAPPSEDEMFEMLSNPVVAQSMNEALNNPQILDLMIQSNPMLRNMPNAREMLQSPMFRQMMTDPVSLRAAAQMRRMMESGQGANAFPAPGVTDTTPAGSAGNTTNAQNQQAPQFPMFPGLFGAPSGGAAGGQAQNPFFALLNRSFANPTQPAGSPSAGQPAASQTAPGNMTAQSGATPATTTPTSPPPAGGNPAAANPFLRSVAPQAGQAQGQGSAASPFGLTPEMLQQIMQAMGAAQTAPPDNRPPEERYADQLRQLNDMGFYDFDRNIAALRRSGGSVQGAVEYLLSG